VSGEHEIPTWLPPGATGSPRYPKSSSTKESEACYKTDLQHFQVTDVDEKILTSMLVVQHCMLPVLHWLTWRALMLVGTAVATATTEKRMAEKRMNMLASIWSSCRPAMYTASICTLNSPSCVLHGADRPPGKELDWTCNDSGTNFPPSITVNFCQEYRMCDYVRIRAVSPTRAQSGEGVSMMERHTSRANRKGY
jgi:hypothetical protein